MLLVSRQVPVSQQYWRERIGPSLADRSRVELALLPRLSLTRLSRTQALFWRIIRSSLSLYYPQGAQQPRCILSYRNKRSVANHIDKPLPASARIDRAGEARRGWMSERLKESVLKTEVLIGIPGVRIPLHPRSHKFSLALSIDKNESDRLD